MQVLWEARPKSDEQNRLLQKNARETDYGKKMDGKKIGIRGRSSWSHAALFRVSDSADTSLKDFVI